MSASGAGRRLKVRDAVDAAFPLGGEGDECERPSLTTNESVEGKEGGGR